jgi:hypothetical protein
VKPSGSREEIAECKMQNEDFSILQFAISVVPNGG